MLTEFVNIDRFIIFILFTELQIFAGHDHRIRLRATRMTSPDIRAGVALLIDAMSAEGTSTIQNIDQIDRGYKEIDTRLNALGAKITRIEE